MTHKLDKYETRKHVNNQILPSYARNKPAFDKSSDGKLNSTKVGAELTTKQKIQMWEKSNKVEKEVKSNLSRENSNNRSFNRLNLEKTSKAVLKPVKNSPKQTIPMFNKQHNGSFASIGSFNFEAGHCSFQPQVKLSTNTEMFQEDVNNEEEEAIVEFDLGKANKIVTLNDDFSASVQRNIKKVASNLYRQKNYIRKKMKPADDATASRGGTLVGKMTSNLQRKKNLIKRKLTPQPDDDDSIVGKVTSKIRRQKDIIKKKFTYQEDEDDIF